MRTGNAIWKEYIPAEAKLDELEAERQLAKAGLRIGAVAAGLIGIWAVACLIGGIVEAGGLGELVKGFMTAIGG